MGIAIEYNIDFYIMKSIHDFLVTPAGKRYNNTKEVEGTN